MRGLLNIVALVSMAGVAGAATVHTSLASFLPNIAPGYYFEDFNSYSFFAGSYSFTGVNGYSFDASSGDGSGVGIYPNLAVTEYFLSTNGYSSGGDPDDLVITFTGAPVTAFGFNLPASGGAEVGDVTITLSDSTVVSVTNATFADFRGFTSAVAITSFTLHSDTPFVWAGLDNFYVGSMAQHPMIPLPSAAGLGGAGLLAFGALRRRR